ncbi:MAG: RNA-protein complex protein Nop10 [Thermoplasmata archaeon]
MKSYIRKCKKCKNYTLKNTCPKCGTETSVSIPARFSPEDHYGEYRRRLRRLEESKMNLNQFEDKNKKEK